jgi:NitT/TauT family transport system ATP-binding protein
VFLADRVVVMSPRPGRIAQVVKVELGQRNFETRESPDFFAAITAVREALRGGSDEPAVGPALGAL